jgi:amidase
MRGRLAEWQTGSEGVLIELSYGWSLLRPGCVCTFLGEQLCPAISELLADECDRLFDLAEIDESEPEQPTQAGHALAIDGVQLAWAEGAAPRLGRMGSAELISASAAELAGLIAAREVSAREVVQAHLRRIDAVNAAINAVVQVDGERAVARAREADAALARGECWGPLHGVPFTVKDNIAAAGIVMAIGVRERAGMAAGQDATAVARLKAAGAILLGKTNCPPWGGGIETDNELYGRTSNPYDLTRTPGGSSGGEAAIIAAQGSPCGLGTDSGASVRLPAHFCGLASIKPSAGRVPLTGVLDDQGQLGTLGDPRTQLGVLARSVADVALLLDLIAGPDGHDAGVAPALLGDPADVDLRDLRVAVQLDNQHHAATPDTVATLEQAAAALRAAGATVEQARHPGGGHELTIEVWRSYRGDVGADQLWRLLRRCDAFRSQMLAFAERYSLLLCPVFPSAARPHGTMNVPGQIDPTSFTTPHSLTGWPAATVRCGTSADSLPIDVQLVARPWRDDVALAAALRLEHDLGGWRPPGA